MRQELMARVSPHLTIRDKRLFFKNNRLPSIPNVVVTGPRRVPHKL